MIKRGVKCCPLIVGAAFNLNAVQICVPGRVRLFPDGGKIPRRIFRRQIGAGIFQAHIGNSTRTCTSGFFAASKVKIAPQDLFVAVVSS